MRKETRKRPKNDSDEIGVVRNSNLVKGVEGVQKEVVNFDFVIKPKVLGARAQEMVVRDHNIMDKVGKKIIKVEHIGIYNKEEPYQNYNKTEGEV